MSERKIPTTVFHFTDTIRLPWILAERQLNPTRGMCAADYPRPTFLWATTNADCDHTAAVSYATPAGSGDKALNCLSSLCWQRKTSPLGQRCIRSIQSGHRRKSHGSNATDATRARSRSNGCAEQSRSLSSGGSASRRGHITDAGDRLISRRIRRSAWTQIMRARLFKHSINRSTKSVQPSSRSMAVLMFRSAYPAQRTHDVHIRCGLKRPAVINGTVHASREERQ
jgi:hypothetical protein